MLYIYRKQPLLPVAGIEAQVTPQTEFELIGRELPGTQARYYRLRNIKMS